MSRRIGTLANYAEMRKIHATGKLVHGEVGEKAAPAVTLTTLFPLDQMTAAEHEVQDALKKALPS